jgi:hypothetical protein
MKYLIGILLLLTTSIFSTSSMANRNFPIPIANIYVPLGFDSNDKVQVYVTGYLPSICYQGPEYKVKAVRGNKVFIDLEAQLKSIPGMACPEVVIPFSQTIRLG